MLSGRGGKDLLTPGDTPGERNDVRCGGGRDIVVFAQVFTLIRGTASGSRPFDGSVSVRPRIRLRSGGRVSAAAFCGDGDTIVCFLEVELISPPPGSRRLAPRLDEPTGNGRTTLQFTLNARGREYLGNGGKVVCVNDDESGYCMRVPRR